MKTKQKRNKWISISLMVAMLLAILPPLTVSAAATISITNLYSPNPNAPAPGNYDDSLVNKFTVNPIEVDALINGIADDQITDMYYEIFNANTNQTSTIKTNKAVKSISNSSEVSFKNVQLSPGKNVITIKFGTTGNIASTPAYAYYTPVTNISNLQFNGVDFLDGGIYPKGPPYTGVSITGTSSNANAIEANYGGTVYQPAAFQNGNFTYVANTTRPTDLNFNPGDNKVVFAANNLTNYYTTNRSFIYDNGKAFAYNAFIDIYGINPSQNQKLVDNPTLQDAATTPIKDVALTANIKNPLISANSTVTQFVYVDVYTSGMASTKLHFDFTNTSTNPTLTTSGSLNTSGNAVLNSATLVQDPTLSTTDYYGYVFKGKLPVNPTSTVQQVNFVFTDSNGLTTTSQYSYSYVDPNQPYVDHVNIKRTPSVGGTAYETAISPSGTTQISEFPATLEAYASGNTDKVEIQLNGVNYPDAGNSGNKFFTVSKPAVDASNNPINDANGNQLKDFSISLQGIADGPVVMKVIPYIGAAAYTAGTKQYSLNISGAPYVIINNLFTGMVVDSSSKLTCGTGTSGPCITGRLVNVPTADYGTEIYSINGTVITPTAGNNPTGGAGGNNGAFKLTSTELNPIFKGDGKYTFKVQLKVNGQLITTSSVDIFVLSNNVPAINYLKPVEADPLNPQFIATSQPDTYVTRATTVQFQGEIVNSVIGATPGTALYLRKAPANYSNALIPVGGQIVLNAILTSAPLQVFNTPVSTPTVPNPSAISMSEYGNYVFELVSANNTSGSTANKLITITREPVPYAFISPQQNQIIKNSSGLDQASINQNFYMIQLQADNADSITFGKDLAVYDKINKKYLYEVKNLKAGANTIKFTVNRGTSKTNASIILFNTNTDIEGEQYKTPLASSSLKIFNGQIQLNFPKDTKLMRNDRTSTTQFITTDRQILFGIANNDDGRIDKPNESLIGVNYLTTPAHYRTASKKYWIDAGIIPPTSNASTPGLQDAYLGSGILPNTTNPSQTAFYVRNYNDLVVPTKRGTLTLSYDSNITSDAGKYISVFQFGYFDNPTGLGPALPSWKNIGGIVDQKNNTITVPVDSFGYFQVMYMDDSFNDVTNHPWARDNLDTLYSKGIMLPKTPYQFMPNDAISRGEFVTMLVKIFDIPLLNQDTQQSAYNNTSSTFLDVQRGFTDPTGLTNFLSIEAAARAGIIRGNANGTFLPRAPITRQDAAVIIARAAELKLTSDEKKSLAALQKVFTDANSVDIYAVSSVEAVAKAALIEGKDNVLLQGQKKLTQRFDPTENFTRAEAAEVAIRVMKQQKKLPK
ncbi:S-layer homology domain-containing protein [Paenibacillus frigoriresistens]|uniref:S-layer homology domain-containing protein n=1 Tax=Paenibacillus alginolyticus TaxID=59839 RepID=UPI0015667AD8|nr:S-layer homology domain-containing protein [Paenibacillus frigoriresistens]NRF96031.1 S-layer homology domain-containing protein [Paenibacillus frigoriresistens]